MYSRLKLAARIGKLASEGQLLVTYHRKDSQMKRYGIERRQFMQYLRQFPRYRH